VDFLFKYFLFDRPDRRGNFLCGDELQGSWVGIFETGALLPTSLPL